MSAFTIDLPEGLRSRVLARATESGFESIEAYVQALLLADAAAGPELDDAQLEALLIGRLDGPFVEVDRADFRRMREKLEGRIRDQSRGTADDAGSEPRP